MVVVRVVCGAQVCDTGPGGAAGSGAVERDGRVPWGRGFAAGPGAATGELVRG